MLGTNHFHDIISDLLQKLHVIKNKYMSAVVCYTDCNCWVFFFSKLSTFFAKTKEWLCFCKNSKIQNIWNKNSL